MKYSIESRNTSRLAADITKTAMTMVSRYWQQDFLMLDRKMVLQLFVCTFAMESRDMSTPHLAIVRADCKILRLLRKISRHESGASWWIICNRRFGKLSLLLRSLGIRYLWDGCFVIIQDNAADKVVQIGAIGKIYKNSAITIPAGSASSRMGRFISTSRSCASQEL
jgi:hypothetical protein